ncbi:MAG: P-II family nitrogen regulator [Veillonellales bacterium]
MKEIIAIIRMNMISKTKEALLKSNFPSFTCRQVVGRGKTKVGYTITDETARSEAVANDREKAEQLAEQHRLVPRRMMTLLVKDEDLKEAIDLIIGVNRTGNPGDGKIFVLPASEVIRVRTGEKNADAL